MNKIRQVKELNKRELEAGITPEASWHADYRDTAFVYIGGLPYDVSEGDIVTIFSQYGEPTYINLVRDKETGKSKGFAFLKYEDQRSCDLAVDNLSGAQVMGRVISVDHTRYKKKDGEELRDNTYGAPDEADEAAGAMAKAVETESESEEERRPVLKEERELAELMRNHDDDDPMKAYLISEKKTEVEEVIKEWNAKNGGSKKTKKDDKRKHRHHRSRRDRDENDEERRHRRRRHRSRSPSEERSKSRERRRRDYSEDRDRKSKRRDYSEDRDRKSRRRDSSKDGERRNKRRDDSEERNRRDRRRDHSRDRERKSKHHADSEEDYRRERRRDRSREVDVKESLRRRRSP